MTTLVLENTPSDCWNSIGIRGDRSCPKLIEYVLCQNCPVFADAGRRFLDARSPEGYLEEWTSRLAVKAEVIASDQTSVLVFRVADEWLALPVQALVEVMTPLPVHSVPFRAGLLAGLVNIRGELQLCIHLAKLLGIADRNAQAPPEELGTQQAIASPRRFLVTTHKAERWVFPVEEVDQVCQVSLADIQPAPATVMRSTQHFSSGMFSCAGRTVGLIDEGRIFDTLQRKLR